MLMAASKKSSGGTFLSEATRPQSPLSGLDVQGPDRSVQPKVVDNLKQWLFFAKSKKAEAVWILGNQELDRYITVPESRMPIVDRIIRYFDGRHSIESIESDFLREGKKVDIYELYRRLSATGLIASPAPSRILPGDIERNLVKLFHVHVEKFFRWLARFTDLFFPFGLLLTLVCIVAGAACLAEKPDLLSQPLGRSGFKSAADIWLYMGLIFVSFFFHEIAHGFVASRYGLYARKFEAGLYFGLIPMFYLRIGGLYTLPAKERIKVWSAGVYWNLTFAAACILFLHNSAVSSTSHIVGLTAISNLTIALSNLFPFLPTDGYFLLATMLRRHNIRKRSWSELRKMFTSGGRDFSFFAVAYALVSSIILGKWIMSNVMWMWSSHPLQSTGSVLRTLLFAVPVSIILFRRFGKSAAFKYLSQYRSRQNG